MGSSWKRQGVEEPFCHDDRRMGEHTFLTFSSSVRNSLIKYDKFCQPTRYTSIISQSTDFRYWSLAREERLPADFATFCVGSAVTSCALSRGMRARLAT